MSPAIRRSAAVFCGLALTSLTACGGSDAGGEGSAATEIQASAAAAQEAPTNVYGDSMPHPTVTLTTSEGDIRLELFPENAPVSVENFLAYVEAGHYDGLIFHRVMPGFMIQAGGHTPDMAQREAQRDAIQNESDNGLRNLRGTLAMARMPGPNSARAQFFINLVDNAPLDFGGQSASPGGWGYAVFGRVIDGIDVVDAIAAKETGRVGPYSNVPIDTVVIESAERGDDIEPE